MAVPTTSAVADRLLNWFEQHRRDLPWRRPGARKVAGSRSAYATWISEIMLQQTRVEAVIPYFEAWMRSFPDLGSLAEAAEEDVLRHWAGLGYYRRARLLHAAAKQVYAEHGGRIPTTATALRALPGIGEYTAAAIASIAFGEAVPVVDGNVKRVAARFLARALRLDEPALHRSARDWVAGLHAQLEGGGEAGDSDVGGGEAGNLNEALMELGATVCTPKDPQCANCPLHGSCRAFAAGTPLAYPAARRPKQWTEVELWYGLGIGADGVCLVQRQEGWNPGLWEPPSMRAEVAGLTSAQVASRWSQPSKWLQPSAWSQPPSTELDDEVGETTASAPGLGAELGLVRHTITHHRIRARVFELQDWPTAMEHDAAGVALTGLARKILSQFA